MTKIQLAYEIMEETQPLASDQCAKVKIEDEESANEIILAAAQCGECGEDVIEEDELNQMVAIASGYDQWYGLLIQALAHHRCQ